jgi:uncharacterized protein YecE (DUF72 family)
LVGADWNAARVPVQVGCSGWQYRSWRARFYPEQIPTSKWLEYYAGLFSTVEVNNTFYRLPDRRVFEAWRRRLPPGFSMSVKASRYLTHMKKLRQPARPLRRLLTRVAALQSHLGAILYQLPEEMQADAPRLHHFLSEIRRISSSVRASRPLAPPFQHVLEFRHPSWYTDGTFEMLAAHDVSLCLHDKAGSPTPRVVVGPVAYLRFHGPTGVYQGEYSTRALRSWARWIDGRRQAGVPVLAYFNNDPDAAATRNARALREIVG